MCSSVWRVFLILLNYSEKCTFCKYHHIRFQANISVSSFQLNLPEKHTHSKKFLSDWRAISGSLGLDARDECTSSFTCWLSTTFFPSWTMVTSQNSGAFFLIYFPFAIFFPSLLKNDEHNPLNRKLIGLESPVTLSVDLDISFVES